MKKLTKDEIADFVDDHCDDYLLGVSLFELLSAIQEDDIDSKQSKLDMSNCFMGKRYEKLDCQIKQRLNDREFDHLTKEEKANLKDAGFCNPMKSRVDSKKTPYGN